MDIGLQGRCAVKNTRERLQARRLRYDPRVTAHSFQPHARIFDDLGPFGDFALDVIGELLRRAADDFRAERAQPLAPCRVAAPSRWLSCAGQCASVAWSIVNRISVIGICPRSA